MFKVCFLHEPESDKPYICKVAVPHYGKFVIYSYAFNRCDQMFEIGQKYYTEHMTNPFAVGAFHERTVRAFEAQPELPFANWNNAKAGY